MAEIMGYSVAMWNLVYEKKPDFHKHLIICSNNEGEDIKKLQSQNTIWKNTSDIPSITEIKEFSADIPKADTVENKKSDGNMTVLVGSKKFYITHMTVTGDLQQEKNYFCFFQQSNIYF